MAKQTSERFGAEEYRRGALARLREALTLVEAQHFPGSIYLAGRGVEAMLRAILWKNDPELQQGKKTLETGHDLRQILARVRNLGLLSPERGDSTFEAQVQEVGRLWFNNMRFASAKYIERYWRRLGEVHSRRTLKKAAGEFCESCSAIIKRCEVIYGRTK